MILSENIQASQWIPENLLSQTFGFTLQDDLISKSQTLDLSILIPTVCWPFLFSGVENIRNLKVAPSVYLQLIYL